MAGVVIGVVSLVLTACGGGSSSNGGGDPHPEPTNQAPTVAVGSASLREGASTTVKALASDVDGTITSIVWEQKSGVALELAGVDTEEVSIQAPAVTENSVATLVVTVTDDDGATTTEEVVVSVLAHMIGFNIKGVVTERVEAETEILFTVGDQLFSTLVGAGGQYSIPIYVDDSRASEIVRADVTNQASKLKLVSLLGDMATVIDAAGEDDVVTDDELLSVNVSSLTTALAAQIEQGEPESISTQEQLTARKKLIDGEDAFQLATLIKLVLDYSESTGVAMPSDVQDTYDLVADRETAALLAAQIREDSAVIYEAAEGAILADPLQVVSMLSDISGIPDTYYFTSANDNPGYRLTLTPSGDGTLSGNSLNGVSEITWTATSEGLEIQGAETVINRYNSYDEILGQNVLAEVVLQPKLIKWIDRGGPIDWMVVLADQYTRYPNGEYPSTEPESRTNTPLAIRSAGTVDATQVLQLGLGISVPVPPVSLEVTEPSSQAPDSGLLSQAVELTFSGTVETGGSVTVSEDSISGNGTPSSAQAVSSWSINSNGHLKVQDIVGNSAEFVFLHAGGDSSPLVFAELEVGSYKRSLTGKAYLKETPAWTADRTVGIYKPALVFNSPLDVYWFEVNEDGTAWFVSGWDQNGDGDLSPDEFYVRPGYWRDNDAGNLVIRRYYAPNENEYCVPPIWDPAPESDCVLENEREWVLLQDVNNEAVAIRQHYRSFLDRSLDRAEEMPEEHVFDFGLITNMHFSRVESRPFPISYP
ncbi:hypothetical protein [Microbulbifer sp.]|uniref:hypothetical protein n=1 Tax=Microbulbifer sp. TaxID=1908541 RepID=UPI0025904785|nr:hypothetical protein [Microbulbifer sp.]